MIRLKESKLYWTLKQKNKKNKDLAFLCGIKVRRFQQLKAEYKRTGEIPKLNRNRRPKTELSDDQKNLILKALEESAPHQIHLIKNLEQKLKTIS